MRLLSLLSGGIDSPVSSYLVKHAGHSIDFIHFHSVPYTNKSSIDKAKRLAQKVFPGSKIFIVPFVDVQKEIMNHGDPKYRVVLYRRFMFRIAEKVAKENGYDALVTGDSLAQVASQTLVNLSVVQNAVSIRVERPLIGLDKEEIVKIARDIGTYEISIEPHEDCCTLFIPHKPSTMARLDVIEGIESEMDVGALVRGAVEKSEVVEV